MVDSTMVGGNYEDKRKRDFQTRCLPQAGISTLGVVSLFNRWSNGTHGSDDDGIAMQISRDVLVSVFDTCNATLTDDEFRYFNLTLDATAWCLPFPRPDVVADGVSVIRLAVDCNGDVFLGHLVDSMAQGGAVGNFIQRLLASNALRPDQRIPFAGLVSTLQQSSDKDLVPQLLHATAHRFEKVFLHAHDDDVADGLHIEFSYDDDADPDRNRQTAMCASYVLFTKAKLGKPCNVGMITDKGWAHALPLQATLLAVPEHFAAVAPCIVFCLISV